MRPLILKMQAFGPYAERETVDFRQAMETGLFGIYGATGSGKSSIFSALTFALFGESAKGEQHPKSLRSDYAEPDTLTEVELVFEVGARRFRVVRRPDQMRPAKRGGGETEEKHRAWLFEATGIDPESLGEANPGKALAETKVSLVNEIITDLLGYEAAQFRQIVLLPQGRFETFLNAKTEERVKILRELFDVSVYQELTDRLRVQAREARDKVSAQREICLGRITAEGFESVEQLLEGIADLALRCHELHQAQREAEAELKRANETYRVAAQTDKDFAEHAEASKQHDLVMARSQAIEAEKARLARARAAQSLVPAADEVTRAHKAHGAHQRAFADATALQARARRDFDEADDTLKALSKKAEEIEGLQERSRELKRLMAVLEGAERLRREAVDAERAADECARVLAAAENVHKDRVAEQSRLSAEREVAWNNEIRRRDLSLKGHELAGLLKAAQTFEKAQSAVAQAGEWQAQARAVYDETRRTFDAARDAFAIVEAALLESHALHLAAHLEPGRPCPVCGSTDHPAPVSGDAKDADLGTRFRAAKAAFERAHLEVGEASNARAQADAWFQQCKTTLDDLAPTDVPAAEIADQLNALESDLAALRPAQDITILDAEIARASNGAADALKAMEAAREKQSKAHLEANAAQARLESALAPIPEDLRAADRLAAEIDGADDRLAHHARALESATEKMRSAETALASAETALKLADESLAKSKTELSDARARLDAGLEGVGITRRVYDEAQCDIARIEDIEAGIRAFGEERAAATDRLARANRAIAETDRPDIAALKELRDEAEARQKKCVRAVAETTARREQLEKVHDQITTELAAVDRLEQETGPLRDLAKMLSGQNGRNMDLETFSIAAMFEHVLAAANLRLEPMTRGRFRLVRGSEGQGRARRGLDILVEDSYTGSRRQSSTLSGGETFIAALALALGLSDVVESTRGNARLDAIFIDEGFGSLDSSEDAGTLDQVLQSLMDLVGSRRAVGLISHVPLVQQSVPNGFWVSSTPSGSRIETRT